MTGADAVVSTLYKNGVRVIFGYPGGSVLPVYDRLRSSRIKHYMPTHEQHACHAADGYARASGRTGVVLATSGPGATNLVTGIANAYMDSVPLVAITGNVPLPLLGHDAFQETDIAGVTMPITKHNFIVRRRCRRRSVSRGAGGRVRFLLTYRPICFMRPSGTEAGNRFRKSISRFLMPSFKRRQSSSTGRSTRSYVWAAALFRRTRRRR